MKNYVGDSFKGKPVASLSAGQVTSSSLYIAGAKRLFDVVFAIALLPILAPVVLVLWVLTRRDGGPGFYSQDRVGINGKVFKCYKMRSMVVDAEAALAKLCSEDAQIAAEWEENQKIANDPRITRVGAFIRATSLDELPQIWNVIKGDMSFVGPRPFMVEQEVMYREAGGLAYFKLRPGITGLWQTEGRGKTSFVSRVAYDTEYYKDLSLGNDIKFLIKTVGVVFKTTGH